MPTDKYQISFHGAVGGNKTGIGTYFAQLDSANRRAGYKSVAEYGPCGELAALGPEHLPVFRMSSDALHNFDTPRYDLPAAQAAEWHWAMTIENLPPEFDKERVWLEVINEPNKEVSGWLGYFGLRIAELAVAGGYKVALFGFSAGEPEYHDWQTAGMRAFLQYATQHNDSVAIALHEYSLTLDFLVDDPAYYLVGRFQQLLDAAIESGINASALRIFITEFGWTYNDVPEPSIAMAHVANVVQLYERFHQVEFAYIWYLGGGYNDIANKAQRLIVPVTEAALSYVPPEQPDPPPQDETLEEFLWRRTTEKQIECGIQLNADAALQGAILDKGLIAVHNEVYESYDGATYVAQAGEDQAGVKPREVFVWQPGKEVWSFTEPINPVPPSGDLVLTHWPSTSRYITQFFGENPQDYAQFGLPGHNGWDMRSPLDSPYYAAADGVVSFVGDTVPSDGTVSAYGWHVRIDHGNGFTAIYAHARANPPVSVGQEVRGGQIIAYSGNTGNSTGPHLHFELRKCPGLDGWPWCIIDPSEYLKPIWGGQPPSTGIDMKPYFQPVDEGNGPFFVLQHVVNGQTTVTEDIQHQVYGGEVFIVKNSQYEHLRVGAATIDRREDTSMGEGRFYVLDDGNGWSKWMPRFWSPGNVYVRSPVVRVMYKDTCQVISIQGPVTSWIAFIQMHDVWESPGGIVLQNVAQFEWRPTADGKPIESYWYAPGVGMVMWQNHGANAISYVSEIPQGRAPLGREVIHCQF